MQRQVKQVEQIMEVELKFVDKHDFTHFEAIHLQSGEQSEPENFHTDLQTKCEVSRK